MVDVQHSFSSLECQDSFTYKWSLSDSPVVYVQIEQLVRDLNGTECPALDIGLANATFQLGANACFSLKDFFAGYSGSFACGSVLSLNGGAKGACETLLAPSSSVDLGTSRALGIGSVVILTGGCAYFGRTLAEFIGDGWNAVFGTPELVTDTRV